MYQIEANELKKYFYQNHSKPRKPRQNRYLESKRSSDRLCMNKLIKLTLFYLLVLLISSCSSNVSITASTAGQISSTVPGSVIEFDLPTQTLEESAGLVTIPLTLNQAVTRNMVIAFQLGGSAELGADYSLLSTSPILIPAGQRTVNIQIQINDDSLVESTETIIITLVATINGPSLGAQTTHILSILDDGLTVDTQGPLAPASITLGAVPSNLTTSPSISWTAATDVGPSGVAYYQVHLYQGASAIGSWVTKSSGEPLTGLSLTNGVSYSLSVRAVDVAGNLGAIGQSATWTALAGNTTAFITSWDTTRPGVSANNQIKLPLVNGGNYNFTVNWGDGQESTIASWNDPNSTHTYAASGVYEVTIQGTFDRLRFDFAPASDRQKIMEVRQWGDLAWSSMESAFKGCTNVRITALDAPDLNYAVSMRAMFYSATAFNDSINHWDVYNITDMSELFYQASSFNQSLNAWDVSDVTDMNAMFLLATSFNQPLNSWNVSAVTSMSNMFSSASSFNQSLNNWNVSKVENMSFIFFGASAFNQDLSSWNVGNVSSRDQFDNGAGNWLPAYKPTFP